MYYKLTRTELHLQPDPRVLFQGINPASPIIVAVSGGSDSMALLLLAAAWARSRGAQLHVVTVDHGLRPEAAAEAAYVAGVCERMGLGHITLAWEGIKPTTGVSDAARDARYTLLEEFASDLGARTILTGHTRDDQAETIAMRLERYVPEGANSQGSTSRGLAGMARVTTLPAGTRLIRPLLTFSREDLRSYLATVSQSWIEDPSNFDSSYERVRVRAALTDNPQRAKNLVAYGAIMGRFRALHAARAASLLQKQASITAGPVYRFENSNLDEVPAPVVGSAIQTLIAVAGGGEHLVPLRKLDELIEAMAKARSTEEPVSFRCNLGRAVVELGRERLLIYREARNVPAILVGPGDRELWDGRFHVFNETNSSMFIGPSDMSLLLEDERRQGRRLEVKPRAALRSTPVIKGDTDEVYYPMAERKTLPPRIYFKLGARALEFFCPQWDEPLVEWVHDLELVGKATFMGRSTN